MPGDLVDPRPPSTNQDVAGFLRQAIGYFVDPETRWDTPYLGGGNVSRAPRSGSGRFFAELDRHAPTGGGVVIVAHGGVNNAVLGRILGTVEPGLANIGAGLRRPQHHRPRRWPARAPAPELHRLRSAQGRPRGEAAWPCLQSILETGLRVPPRGPDGDPTVAPFPSLDQKFVLTSPLATFKLDPRTVSFAPASSSSGCTVPTHDRCALRCAPRPCESVSGERPRR